MATHSEDAAARVAPPRDQPTAPTRGDARQYDEYRVKLYKVACREARDKRERLRLDWEARSRDED